MSEATDTQLPNGHTADLPSGYTPTPESENPLYRVEVPSFEGPLDLLLFLIKKHDVDILDIPIGMITERYIQHLDVMEARGWQDVSLDSAAGFLALAAELAYIKSRMLVPQPETAEDDEELGDPRADLVHRLLEYQKYKEAGEQLASRDMLGRDVFLRRVQIDPSLIPTETPLADVPLFRLVEALDRVLQTTKIELKHEVVLDQLSVADKLNQLIDRLQKEAVISFYALFENLQTRREIIAMFLAVLEVGKMKLIRLQQETLEGDIVLRAVPEKLAELLAEQKEMASGIDYR